jgi:type I restriction enzyme M protein
MHWIAPSEKDTANGTLEKRLWDAADQFRANSGLTAAQYSQPVLGLIFLRFAEVRFAAQRTKLDKTAPTSRRGSRLDDPSAYHAEGVLYLTPDARFDHLLALPEAADVGKAINDAMRDIEKHNPLLAGVLPKTYNIFTSTLLKELLKKVSEIPATLDYDAFGRIYEYFLGEFAMTEGQGGGEFTLPPPSSVSSLKSSSHIMAAFSIPRAARAVCSYHPHASYPNIGRIPRLSSPFTAWKKPTKPDASVA